MLVWPGWRCDTTTKAIPVLFGMSRNSSSSASNPPAEEPTPTTGNPVARSGRTRGDVAFAPASFAPLRRSEAKAVTTGLAWRTPRAFECLAEELFLFIFLRSRAARGVGGRPVRRGSACRTMVQRRSRQAPSTPGWASGNSLRGLLHSRYRIDDSATTLDDSAPSRVGNWGSHGPCSAPAKAARSSNSTTQFFDGSRDSIVE